MDFEITVKPSFEAYKAFSMTVAKRVQHLRQRCILKSVVMVVILGIFIWMESYLLCAGFAAAWGIAIAIGYARSQKNLRKTWESNAVLRESETHLHFTENGIDVTTQNGSAHIDYDKLYKLLETKTHFYILSASNAGTGIPKAQCTPAQQDFIRTHCAK